MYRDDIDEDRSFLMSLVPSKKLNDEQKIVAKVEFLNVMRRITFYQPSYHVSNSFHFPYFNLPGPSAHTSYIGILPNVTVPSRTHHKNQSPQNPYSEFTPSPHNCSTNSAFTSSSGTPFTRVTLWWKHFVTINRFRTVSATFDISWLYEAYSESKYRFAVKKSSKVSYKILLLSDSTFFKLFSHIFAAIIEELIVAGHKFLYTLRTECVRLRC